MPKTPPFRRRAVLCDLDGLLLDSLDIWNEVDLLFLDRHQFYSDEHLRVLRNSGKLEEAAAGMQAAGLAITEEDFKREILELLQAAYHSRAHLFPGAREFLERQQAAGARLALITASPESLVGPVLDRLDIRKFFDLLLLEADKHTPLVFYQAMEQFGTTREETVIYDDLPRIQDMARRAGFTVYGSIHEGP